MGVVNVLSGQFSAGWFDVKYLNGCPLLLVCGPDNRIEAFANIVLEGNAD